MKMNRCVFLAFLLQCSFHFSFAQSLFPYVIPASGGFYANGGYSLSYTIGELAVNKLTNSSAILTEGFQQPIDSGTGSVAVYNDEIEQWKVNIYPNPVFSILTLELCTNQSVNYSVDLFDLFGRQIFRKEINVRQGDMPMYSLSLESIPPSLYILSVTSDDEKIKRIFKVNKMK